MNRACQEKDSGRVESVEGSGMSYFNEEWMQLKDRFTWGETSLGKKEGKIVERGMWKSGR